MRNGAVVLSMCLGMALAGCSSEPGAGDVEPHLKEHWGNLCPGLKVTDLKKTNGIDRGKIYEVAYSYKLEFTKDMIGEDAKMLRTACPLHMVLEGEKVEGINMAGQRLLTGLLLEAGVFGEEFKAGEGIIVSDSITMVKSEKGWIPSNN